MDDVHIRNRKSWFFSKSKKNQNLDFVIISREELGDHVRNTSDHDHITPRRSATVQIRPTTDVW